MGRATYGHPARADSCPTPTPQRARLRGLQSGYPKMALLHGTELNIDPEGGVDWPAEFLEGFDVCVAGAAKLVGKKVSVQVERVLGTVAYATLVGKAQEAEEPITASTQRLET